MEFFIPLLFFIIWFLGWIFNLNDQNKKGGNVPRRGQQPGQPRPEGRQKLQNEIDAFLNEIGAKREQKDEGVEVVRHDQIRREKQEERRRLEQKRRQEERQRQQQQSRRPKPASQKSQKSSQRSSSSSQKRRESEPANRQSSDHKKLGSGVTSHVDQYMNSHIEQYMAARKSGLSKDQAARAMSRELSDEQMADAEKQLDDANFQGVSAAMQPGDYHPANIVKMMQSPHTVRTAIIMNEILQRPKSLQK